MKKLQFISIFLLALFIISCNDGQNKEKQSHNFSFEKLQNEMVKNFGFIDSLKSSAFYPEKSIEYDEMIDSLNHDILNSLKKLTVKNRFKSFKPNNNLKSFLSYNKSADNKFCIVSWDTRQGGTMIDYTSSVLFEENEKSKIKTLEYGSENFKDNCKIFFDTVLTLNNYEGKTIYLTYGFGQGSTLLPYRVLKAFKIENGIIENFPLFPDNSSTIWITYDYSDWRESDEIMNIQFIDGGKQLKIPILDDKSRPTNQYYTLNFDGTKFVP